MSRDDDQSNFEEQHVTLLKQFEDAEIAGESDDNLGKAILDLILESERLRRGGAGLSKHIEIVDQETLEKLANWDSNDPTMSTIEKVFKRLSNDRFSDASQLLKASIEAKQHQISEQQRARALKPRKKHPIKALIEQIVAKRPQITDSELLEELRTEIGNGVILDIDEEFIDPADINFSPIKISGLKDQLSRVKKSLSP